MVAQPLSATATNAGGRCGLPTTWRFSHLLSDPLRMKLFQTRSGTGRSPRPFPFRSSRSFRFGNGHFNVSVTVACELQRDRDQVILGPGDVLLVPAGQEHRFVDFGDDFATWVFVYGPDGGEGNGERQSSSSTLLGQTSNQSKTQPSTPAYTESMSERELIATQRDAKYVVGGRCSVCSLAFDSPIHSALRASNQVVRDFENHTCRTEANHAAARIVAGPGEKVKS
jgi:hypothetical protein